MTCRVKSAGQLKNKWHAEIGKLWQKTCCLCTFSITSWCSVYWSQRHHVSHNIWDKVEMGLLFGHQNAIWQTMRKSCIHTCGEVRAHAKFDSLWYQYIAVVPQFVRYRCGGIMCFMLSICHMLLQSTYTCIWYTKPHAVRLISLCDRKRTTWPAWLSWPCYLLLS